MTEDELKAISKAGNLHPSNKVMDILRKVVRATKEEDASIAYGIKAPEEFSFTEASLFDTATICAGDAILASK